MLCPETWNFPIPDHNIQYEMGVLNPSNENKLNKMIDSHFFNKMISLVLPNSSNTPEEILKQFEGSEYYEIENIQLYELVNHSFLEGFVKRGTIYAISVNTNLDTDECFVIAPNGKLVLNIHKEVFQTLGLEGKVSHFSPKLAERFTIEIDLKTLRHDSKLYARLKNALLKPVLKKFKIHLTWIPPKGTAVCSSSVAKYFSDANYSVKLCKTKLQLHQYSSIGMPELGNPKDNFDFCSLNELVEFVGMVALDCKMESEEFLNTYSCPQPTAIVQNMRVLNLQGFFTCEMLRQLFVELRSFTKLQPNIPWASMYVHGHPHSAVSFGMKEHLFHSNGDNSYLIFLKPQSNEYAWYRFLSSNKIPK